MSRTSARLHVVPRAKKRMFDEGWQYTEEGLECYSEALGVLIPLFTKLLNQGYAPRDITNMVVTIAVDLQSQALAMKRLS